MNRHVDSRFSDAHSLAAAFSFGAASLTHTTWHLLFYMRVASGPRGWRLRRLSLSFQIAFLSVACLAAVVTSATCGRCHSAAQDSVLFVGRRMLLA